jgi:hypothetical protein
LTKEPRVDHLDRLHHLPQHQAQGWRAGSPLDRTRDAER